MTPEQRRAALQAFAVGIDACRDAGLDWHDTMDFFATTLISKEDLERALHEGFPLVHPDVIELAALSEHPDTPVVC